MKRVGIGEAYIGLINGQSNLKAGEVKVLGDPFWDVMAHTFREGTRLGVDIGVFNSPGWSQSGGPWVKPEQAMRHCPPRSGSVGVRRRIFQAKRPCRNPACWARLQSKLWKQSPCFESTKQGCLLSRFSLGWPDTPSTWFCGRADVWPVIGLSNKAQSLCPPCVWS